MLSIILIIFLRNKNYLSTSSDQNSDDGDESEEDRPLSEAIERGGVVAVGVEGGDDGGGERSDGEGGQGADETGAAALRHPQGEVGNRHQGGDGQIGQHHVLLQGGAPKAELHFQAAVFAAGGVGGAVVVAIGLQLERLCGQLVVDNHGVQVVAPQEHEIFVCVGI